MIPGKFLVIPAVDIKGGRCVRLWRGRADSETVFDEDPVRAALRWQEEGAELLHVVDLDGAFEGRPVNDEAVLGIAGRLDIPIEVGGGIRNSETARYYVEGGVERVIVGTAAFKDPEWLREIAAELGERLVVGMDVKQGTVAVKGWLEEAEEEPRAALERLEDAGVRRVIYTNTRADGTLGGPDIEGIGTLAGATSIPLIASGGVSSVEDILQVARMRSRGVEGVITGMALYRGGISLRETLEALEREVD